VRGAIGLALLSVACGASPSESEPPPSDARFPLEVVGVCPESGTCAQVELDLHVDGAALANATQAELRLSVHNVVQADMARLVLNDSSVYDLGAPLVRAHGGVAEGSVSVDIEALHAGDNRLRFEYTRQVPDVSGYRVLSVELVLGDASTPLELDWDDPTAWQAPTMDAAAIERGRRYFSEESRDGGPVCARCHADSGADLAYFAFSNAGVVERARHHEFTQAEAREIASYLRTLDVAPRGTVFDPPFVSRGRGALGRDRFSHRA
jgi:hypothetical protein